MPAHIREASWLVALGIVVALGGAVSVAVGQAAAKAQSYKPDQKVEVREGDEWSAATVVAKEGRKYQIRYDDGTDEWVTAERLRQPGAAGAGKAQTAPAPPKTGKAAAKGNAPRDAKAGAKGGAKRGADKEQFSVGAKVEVQTGSRWEAATVKNRDGDLYLVVRNGWDQEMFWRWYHVSSVRGPGSNKRGVQWPKFAPVGGFGIAKSKTLARRLFENIDSELAAEAHQPQDDLFAPPTFDKPVAQSNFGKVKTLSVNDAPDKLATFDPAPAEAPALLQKSYVLKGNGERPQDHPKAILLSGTRAILSYQGGSTSEPHTLPLEWLDLAAGKNLGLVKADVSSMPMDVSPSGARLLGRQQGFFTKSQLRVDVFDLPKIAAEPKHVVSFAPYNRDEFFFQGVDWARFADENHVLTLNEMGGDLVCWHVPTTTATWRLKIRQMSRPAWSPGGRQIAVATEGGVAVIDPVAGKVLCVARGARRVLGLGFTPDGKRIIGTSGSTLSAWDLSTGEALPDIGLPPGTSAGEPFALDERFVLIGGKDLVDQEKRVVVWRYLGRSGELVHHGGRTWTTVVDGSKTVLTSATLPHAAALKAAEGVDAGQAFLVKPGDTVSLTVAIEGTTEQSQKIQAAIAEQLRQIGIRVADNSPVKLIARTEQGKTRDQAYRRDHSRSRERVTVTEKITRIYFEADGKVAWESRSSSGIPMFVMAKPGETTDQAVQKAVQFNLAFLEAVRVPAYVPKPTEQPGLGQSRWTGKGLVDEPRRGNPAANPPQGDGLE